MLSVAVIIPLAMIVIYFSFNFRLALALSDVKCSDAWLVHSHASNFWRICILVQT